LAMGKGRNLRMKILAFLLGITCILLGFDDQISFHFGPSALTLFIIPPLLAVACRHGIGSYKLFFNPVKNQAIWHTFGVSSLFSGSIYSLARLVRSGIMDLRFSEKAYSLFHSIIPISFGVFFFFVTAFLIKDEDIEDFEGQQFFKIRVWYFFILVIFYLTAFLKSDILIVLYTDKRLLLIIPAIIFFAFFKYGKKWPVNYVFFKKDKDQSKTFFGFISRAIMGITLIWYFFELKVLFVGVNETIMLTPHLFNSARIILVGHVLLFLLYIWSGIKASFTQVLFCFLTLVPFVLLFHVVFVIKNLSRMGSQ